MKELLLELYNHYYKDVYRYLYSLSHDKYISEDLTSDVFLEVMKSYHSFKHQSDIKTWIFSIARFKWYKYLKKHKQELNIDEFKDIASVNNTNDYDLKSIVENILSSEEDMIKDIFHMRVDGYSYYEIASKYNLKESSIRVMYFRIKNKIKEELKKEGVINE